MLPNIGPMEIAIVLILMLVIFGPKKLPELGRSAGKGLREFKSGLNNHFDDADADELPRAEAEKASDPAPVKTT